MHIFKNIALLLLIGIIGMIGCTRKNHQIDLTDIENAQHQLQSYTVQTKAEIMVFATFHFEGKKEILNTESQNQITQIIDALSKYQPTKIVLEWEPSKLAQTNKEYQSYLAGSFGIADKTNEVYQLGFQLAKKMQHESIYLFDNQTEYIGSLDGFSFIGFNEYAKQNDNGFYNLNEASMVETYNHNQNILKRQNLYNRLALINSPQAQKSKAHRMHMYEIRVGIQKNWIGPDWLSRWYQRNIRMLSNIIKLTENDDKILIIVGDNHKWILETLFKYTPELEVVPSWNYLKKPP